MNAVDRGGRKGRFHAIPGCCIFVCLSFQPPCKMETHGRLFMMQRWATMEVDYCLAHRHNRHGSVFNRASLLGINDDPNFNNQRIPDQPILTGNHHDQ
jgi:hypothetical protein